MAKPDVNATEAATPNWTNAVDDYVTFVHCSPRDGALLVGSLSGQVVILDPESGETLFALAEHPRGALAGGWSQDGNHLATCGHDERVRISHADNPEVFVSALLKGWPGALAWSPVANLLAVASGKSLFVFDAIGDLVGRWDDLASTVTSVAWSVDGTSIGATCYGGVDWFRPGEPNPKPKHFPWKGSLLSLDLSPDGKWAASGCQDASVHIWRLWTGDDMQMSGYPAKIEHTAWDPTSRFLAVGSVGDITIWDFSGKGPQGSRPVTLGGHERHISALQYSPQGSCLATCDAAGTLIFWETKKRPKQIGEHRFSEAISALAWSTDERYLAVGGADGLVSSLRSPVP